MKRILFVITLFGVATVACKKKQGPPSVASVKVDNGIDSLLVMSALVNTKEWKTDSAYSYKVKNSTNDTSLYNLKIVATQFRNNESSTISFDITNFDGVKVYAINPPFNTAAYYNGNIRHFATAGTFTVEADTSGLLSGTFSFIADTVSVLNGSFKVALP